MAKILVVSNELGVYLGTALGLGFFTKLDCAGQTQPCTFPSKQEARGHVASWDANNDPDAYAYHELPDDGNEYATIEELEDAGLGALTVELRAEREKYGECA